MHLEQGICQLEGYMRPLELSVQKASTLLPPPHVCVLPLLAMQTRSPSGVHRRRMLRRNRSNLLLRWLAVLSQCFSLRSTSHRTISESNKIHTKTGTGWEGMEGRGAFLNVSVYVNFTPHDQRKQQDSHEDGNRVRRDEGRAALDRLYSWTGDARLTARLYATHLTNSEGMKIARAALSITWARAWHVYYSPLFSNPPPCIQGFLPLSISWLLKKRHDKFTTHELLNHDWAVDEIADLFNKAVSNK